MTDQEIKIELLQIIRKRDERDKEIFERMSVVETLTKDTRIDIKEIKDVFGDFKIHLDSRCQRHSDKIADVELNTNKRIDKVKWVIFTAVITFIFSICSLVFMTMRYSKTVELETKVIKLLSINKTGGKVL